MVSVGTLHVQRHRGVPALKPHGCAAQAASPEAALPFYADERVFGDRPLAKLSTPSVVAGGSAFVAPIAAR